MGEKTPIWNRGKKYLGYWVTYTGWCPRSRTIYFFHMVRAQDASADALYGNLLKWNTSKRTTEKIDQN